MEQSRQFPFTMADASPADAAECVSYQLQTNAESATRPVLEQRDHDFW